VTGQAQGGRAAPAEEEKLKALLAQKEKEVRELRDRLEALVAAFREKEHLLETALKEKQQQAARALEAEMLARDHAEAERQARLAANSGRAKQPLSPPPMMGPTGSEVVDEAKIHAGADARLHASQIEQAKDEVELLEAKLAAKKAYVKAAAVSLDTAKRATAQGFPDPKIQIELAAMTGQVEVKEAELKESEVLLAQAKRRLEKLTALEKPRPGQNGKPQEQKPSELEKRLDTLIREMEALRMELRRKGSGQP
jgi:hypothetical protein